MVHFQSPLLEETILLFGLIESFLVYPVHETKQQNNKTIVRLTSYVPFKYIFVCSPKLVIA